MSDITAVYYTASFINERFANKVRAQILKAIGDIPLISVSQKPLDFGENICIGDIGRKHLNIYKQALIGAKAAKTKYIALVEDDILYSPDHFMSHRPPSGVFAYNSSQWGIYTWTKPPVFSYKGRRNLYSMISERDLFIEAMEERFKKWPDEDKIPLEHWAEPGKYEGKGHLGVTERPSQLFNTVISNVAFSHEEALSYLNLGNRKKLGDIRAYEIPYWGRAEDVVKLFKE